jgi:hypothetical protein
MIISMMIFNMSTSYFHKISFHYCEELFNDKIGDLRVRSLFIDKVSKHIYLCTLFSFVYKSFDKLQNTLVYLGQFDTNYIIFRIVEIFKKIISSKSKNIVKDISESFDQRYPQNFAQF